jgi:type IV pilus assembly protein PilA
MLHKLMQRARNEKGFTLIELLVVILIIGILAAIALPAFLNQRSKAQDTTAKSDVRSAQTAMETWYTDNQNYSGGTPATLKAIEPTLTNSNILTAVGTAATGYVITVTSKSSDATVYTVTNVAGTFTRTCNKSGKGGCSATGTW